MEKKLNKKRIISNIILVGLWVVAIIYILALLKIVLFKYGFKGGLRELNLKPFEFITEYSWDKENIDVTLKNVLGNFALFIPLGILVPSLFKKVSQKKAILICFGVSLSFEIIQYIFGLGASDVDDLMLNTFGGFIGSLDYFACLKKIDNKANIKIATLGFLGVFGMCSLISLYLYHPSVLPARVEYVNKEVLGNLDTSNYDIEAACIGIEGNILIVDTKKRSFSEHYKNPGNTDGRYMLNDNTKLFVEKIECKWSPNGNVQKTITTYSKITKEELKKMTKEKKIAVALWMGDNNKCNVVLATQHADKN